MSDAPTYQDRQSQRVYLDASEMVNDYLQRFGRSVSIELEPLSPDGYTEVRRGSATVGINVLSEHGILLFMSRIMAVPSEGREALYRRLLELNFLVTSDAAFAIDNDASGIVIMVCLGVLAYLMEDCCNGSPELCRPVINAVTCDC